MASEKLSLSISGRELADCPAGSNYKYPQIPTDQLVGPWCAGWLWGMGTITRRAKYQGVVSIGGAGPGEGGHTSRTRG